MRCVYCQASKNGDPTKAKPHAWPLVSRLFKRIHIDIATPQAGHNYLIIVDAYSKWPEIYPMDNMSSTVVIESLRNLFARFGIPECIVSDSKRQFVSNDLEEFLNSNNVKRIKSAPFHQATIGLAERFIQTFKRAVIERDSFTSKDLENFLMGYRSSPRAITKISPYSIVFNRPMRKKLNTLISKQSEDLQSANQRTTELKVNEHVYIKFYNANTHCWKAGKVSARMGPVTYQVTVDGKIYRRHIDQLKARLIILPEREEEQNQP
ncbi:Gag-Pol polyprotein [Thelohanellus kitauei]|uniref:Gag-Pol polyprotein n=1 Tax=Thelohanellus kitauei TaxID=669202 RepID=A0A0C2MUU9_THEKT|nr:Gag-Pol polyprotein [Thelohanellus kitauei]